MEILRIIERIETACEMGESHFREFKSAYEGDPANKTPRGFKDLCNDIARTLVAFANADGGELLVGIEDNGAITGVDYPDKHLRALLESPKTHVHTKTPLPAFRAIPVEVQKKAILYFSIPKGTEYVYITADGKCLQRKDLESAPIPPEEIKYQRNETKSIEYDRQFVDGARIGDLDISLLQTAAASFSQNISPEKFLQHLDLAEFDGSQFRLRKAALLLFAKDAHKWHPRLQVRILKVMGNEVKSGHQFNVVKDDDVSGNILSLLHMGWDLLRPYLTETKFSSDAIFRSQIIYPELACKEALTNAIAHRDYGIEGRGIEVFIFDDHLEIKSPGELLSSIKIKDLEQRKGVHQSRNSYIARVLREIGYMRELGEGLRRIYDLMESNDLISPELASSNNSFSIKLHQKLVYTKEEQIWMDNFKDLDLSREQRTVVRLGAQGKLISPKAIWESVGIVDTDAYRQLIESLRRLGILESIVSKPETLKIAREKKIRDKKQIPRFIIKVPQSSEASIIRPKASDNTKPPMLDDSDYSKLFIENIPYDATEDEISEFFSKYGDVLDVRLPINPITGKLRGFGFVEFDKNDIALNILKDKNTLFIRSRKLIVKEYKRKEHAL